MHFYRRAYCILATALVFAGHAWASPSQAPTVPLLSRPAAEALTGMTVQQAIDTALVQSPRLQASRKATAAAMAEQEQAGAWPNPEVEGGVENFAGNGAYSSFASSELNLGVSQQIPITGKLAARKAIASAASYSASLDEEATRLDLARDVTIAFMTAVASEASLLLAEDQKELAADVLQSVNRRVGAAAAPLIQRSRSEVELATATLALEKARRERDVARSALAAVLGVSAVNEVLDTTAFYAIQKPEPLPASSALNLSLDTLRLNSSLSQAKARIDLEEANGLPDPRVSAGVREFQATGERAALVSLSLPIPIFDANSGNIEKARQETLGRELLNRQAAADRDADITRAHARLTRSHLEASTLKKSVLPSASQAFRLAREGYAAGRFPYLEVLDAQRSLFFVRQQQLDALREFHIANAELSRLTARASSQSRQPGDFNAD